jgi:hypothetical protein
LAVGQFGYSGRSGQFGYDAPLVQSVRYLLSERRVPLDPSGQVVAGGLTVAPVCEDEIVAERTADEKRWDEVERESQFAVSRSPSP